MIKFLIGGSPCTKWSIAQSNNRETEPRGEGWELFRNFLIAKEKFRPDFFLYENNKSVAPVIKDQISKELESPLQYINSALVSAQRRERFYCHNLGDVPQPEDRGILLQDILDSGLAWQSKSYCLTATEYKGGNIKDVLTNHRRTQIAEPVRIGQTGESGGQGQRVYSPFGKSVALCGNGGGAGAKTGLYACPVGRTGAIEYVPPQGSDIIVTHNSMRCQRRDAKHSSIQGTHVTIPDGKTQAITASHAPKTFDHPIEGESTKNIYQVENGQIEIKGQKYPIRLPDGYYIIRKLSVIECCRLQTLPDDYCRAVSATQGYKGLGNGWTAEVIIHLMRHVLKGVPKDEKILVLSMYDGIGTGRYCFDQLGYKNIEYHTYEIDKYAMQVSMNNYPDIIQHGNAFQVREGGCM